MNLHNDITHHQRLKGILTLSPTTGFLTEFVFHNSSTPVSCRIIFLESNKLGQVPVGHAERGSGPKAQKQLGSGPQPTRKEEMGTSK